MQLTAEERAILAHRKVDVDAWVAHALATVGEWAVRENVEKYREPYFTEKKNRGDGYKPRVTRQADADAVLQAQREASALARDERDAARAADLAEVLKAMPTREAKDAMARLLGAPSNA